MRLLLRSAQLLGLVSVFCTTACGSDAQIAGPEQPLPECTGDVSIQVSTGTQPTFSWTPACRLFFLNVEPATSGEDLWLVISRGANRIAPGLKYGVLPAGAEQRELPVPLVAGNPYKVVLGRYTGPGAEDGELVGVKAFSP
jgi:hypothetical protein